ncbi:class I SAM-dependent methyltransferase [Candidatus Dojkabacteria bacterium]|nr:class I SAM-dependent methyltransferase [Candidatus Dojkabacteria bacterium]
MEKSLIERLVKINETFYSNIYDEFDSSRSTSWPGWKKFWPLLKFNKAIVNILDIGCGNGRFIPFINNFDINYKYTGFDISSELLNLAKKRYVKNNIKFLVGDLLKINESEICDFHYDLITCFNVFHHIPSYRIRVECIKKLISLLNPDGFIVLTFWKFVEFKRFNEHLIPWGSLNVNESDLESGDFIMDWRSFTSKISESSISNSSTQTIPTNVRYCHYFSDAEVDQILSDILSNCDINLINRFRSDGREKKLNEYVILQLV